MIFSLVNFFFFFNLFPRHWAEHKSAAGLHTMPVGKVPRITNISLIVFAGGIIVTVMTVNSVALLQLACLEQQRSLAQLVSG